MSRYVVSRFLDGMVEVTSDSEIVPYVKYSVQASLNLGIVPERTKNQMLLNLRRGYCSSVTGSAYSLYRALALAYKFPVFSVGRGRSIVIGIPCKTGAAKILENLRAVWMLANPEVEPGNPYWRNSYSFRPHNMGVRHGQWQEFRIPRAKTMSIGAVCGAMGVENLWEIIPKAQTEAAASALLRGVKITISTTTEEEE